MVGEGVGWMDSDNDTIMTRKEEGEEILDVYAIVLFFWVSRIYKTARGEERRGK